MRNQRLAAKLKEIAESKGITRAQLAVAWVLAKNNSMVPVMGARTRNQLVDSLGVCCFFPLFVLLYEEPALRRKFGDSYEEYKRRVPRWLPRRPRSG